MASAGATPLFGGGAAGGAPSAPPVPLPAPLATSWTTAGGSWAAVAMGRLAQPHDTFWQLFFRADGGTTWSLVTPPGVADNGGLVVDNGSAPSVTAGFEPNEGLVYSPVARTADDGRSWSPGVLGSGLSAVPDALADEAGGTVLALVRAGGGTLVRSTGSLDGWGTVTTRRAVAATGAGRACGLVALGAVAAGAGSPELGGACSRPGVIGLFSARGGSWHAAGPRPSGASAGDAFSVLRLRSGPSGTTALVEGVRGTATALFALWRAGPSAAWSMSAPLGGPGRLVATGFSAATQVVVVTTAGGGAAARIDVVAPGEGWRRLPAPPAGTAAVAAGAPGSFDALVVDTRFLVDWRLDPSTGRWVRGATVGVPIQYGSST
jgi:hypothetical protein